VRVSGRNAIPVWHRTRIVVPARRSTNRKTWGLSSPVMICLQRPMRCTKPELAMPCFGTAPCGSSINPIGSRRPATTKQGRTCRRLHTISRNSIQRIFHCPGHAGDSQIQQVHWKPIVMNPEGFSFGRVAAAWEGQLAQQCHQVVDGPDIRKVDLTSVGEAARCKAMAAAGSQAGKLLRSSIHKYDFQSRHCSCLAGAVLATKSKRAALPS